MKGFKVNHYHNSLLKRFVDLTFSAIGLLFLSPVYILIFAILKLNNHGPVLFIQERTGKNGKTFKMIKFRTMVVGAHSKQKGLKKLNEADGPVFKIYDDPRFIKFGRFLAHTGLDELPELINVLKNEMSFVGPRPFPISEAEKIPEIYKKTRELIKPGLTSTWVVNGSHKLSFKKWMELDVEYVNHGNLGTDLYLIMATARIVAKGMFEKLFR